MCDIGASVSGGGAGCATAGAGSANGAAVGRVADWNAASTAVRFGPGRLGAAAGGVGGGGTAEIAGAAAGPTRDSTDPVTAVSVVGMATVARTWVPLRSAPLFTSGGAARGVGRGAAGTRGNPALRRGAAVAAGKGRTRARTG